MSETKKSSSTQQNVEAGSAASADLDKLSPKMKWLKENYPDAYEAAIQQDQSKETQLGALAQRLDQLNKQTNDLMKYYTTLQSDSNFMGSPTLNNFAKTIQDNMERISELTTQQNKLIKGDTVQQVLGDQAKASQVLDLDGKAQFTREDVAKMAQDPDSFQKAMLAAKGEGISESGIKQLEGAVQDYIKENVMSNLSGDEAKAGGFSTTPQLQMAQGMMDMYKQPGPTPSQQNHQNPEMSSGNPVDSVINGIKSFFGSSTASASDQVKESSSRLKSMVNR